MDFDISEDQLMLKEQVGRLLAGIASPERLRRHLAGTEPFDVAVWSGLAELGVLGAAIPEAFGGVGLEPLDLGVVFEEMGRTCAPAPLFSSMGLTAEALLLSNDAAAKEEWLPKLCSGEVIGCFAHVEGSGPTISASINAEIRNGLLFGTKTPVADAASAHVAIVVALSNGRPALALARLDDETVERRPLRGVDHLRPYCEIRFSGTPAQVLDVERVAETLSTLYDRAAVYAAFEAVGGAEAALDMARSYALDRKVFSRPIGSLQALKHRLADIFCQLELARSNAWYAAWAIAHAPEEAPAAAAAARLSAIEAYEFAARENLQVHGGIGYTYEANCHFHYRRARLLAAHIGTFGEWSERLVSMLERKPLVDETVQTVEAA